ncbi:MAG: DHHA1 domain-containing protein [Candidatus Aenigmatarchaeota archaeon]
MKSKVVCVYHKNCIDGTSSAAVLLMKHPDANLFSFNYKYSEEEFNSLLSVIDKDTVVYVLDFSFNIHDLNRLLDKSKKVIMIDHHISVKDKFDENFLSNRNLEFIYDTEHSGSSLTYKYFFGDKPNKIIEFVEDRDLWRWKFGDHTNHVNSYLFLFIDNPIKMKDIIENSNVEEILDKGKVINEYKSKLIESVLEKTKEVIIRIDSYNVRAYNTNLFQSEIGSVLCKKYDEVVCLFSFSYDYVILSFRGLEHHNPSALDLAKILGGGGHKNAAGATVSIKKFNDMIQVL